MDQFLDSWYSYQFRYCSVNNSGLSSFFDIFTDLILLHWKILPSPSSVRDSVISLFIYFPQQIQKTGTPSCTNRFPAKNHTFRLGYRLRKHQIQLKFCHSLIHLFFPEPKVRPPLRNPSLRPGQMWKKKPDHRPCHYTVQQVAEPVLCIFHCIVLFFSAYFRPQTARKNRRKQQ